MNATKETYFILDREHSSIVARIFADDIAKIGAIYEFLVGGVVVGNVDTRDGYSVAKLEIGDWKGE